MAAIVRSIESIEMKTITLITTLLVAAAVSAIAHGVKVEIGPKGGRLLPAKGVTGAAYVEFLVVKGGTVELTLLDKGKKTVPIGERAVGITVGKRSEAKILTMSVKGDAAVSAEALPTQGEFPVVIQVNSSRTEPAATIRFNYANGTCDGCKKAEYICTCH